MSGTASTSPRENIRRFHDAIAPLRERFVRRRSAYYDDLHDWLTFRLPQSASVLEIGCGIGNVIAKLPQQKKVGIDVSERMIAIARETDASTSYSVDDVEELSLRETFDTILLLDTVNSLWDVEQALRQIREKLCHEETKLFLTYHNFLWKSPLILAGKWGIKTPMPAQNWLSPSDIRSLLHLAGFEVIDDGERFLWPWHTPIIAPLFNKIFAKLPILRLFTLVHYTIARPIPVARRAPASVSIVIPARNEEGNIARAMEELPTFGSSMEIIFVEGNSGDRTWDAIQTLAREYRGPHRIITLKQTGKGKGDAVRLGFSHATGDILMILDCDLTVPPADLPKFYDAMIAGTGEFLSGSRLVYPMENEAMRFLNILGNKFFSMMFTWLLGQSVKDTLCGTKVLWRHAYESIAQGRSAFGDFDPFGDFDLLFGAARYALPMMEIPVHYRARTYGETNIRRFRDGWLLLRMCMIAARRLKFT